jgi:hypothetical protein
MRSKPNDKLLLTLAAITELKDQEDLKMADRAMREMRRDGLKAIPIDQVIKSINLAVAKETPSSNIF